MHSGRGAQGSHGTRCIGRHHAGAMREGLAADTQGVGDIGQRHVGMRFEVIG